MPFLNKQINSIHMKNNSENFIDLNIVPLTETQQMQIKGGTAADDKSTHRPGTGATTTIPTKGHI